MRRAVLPARMRYASYVDWSHDPTPGKSSSLHASPVSRSRTSAQYPVVACSNFTQYTRGAFAA